MRTDEVIKTDIVNQMRWDTRVDASKVHVSVDNGHIILTGTVPTYTVKQAASDDAWLVNGAKSVSNQLNVKYPATVTIPSDQEIRSNIENLLLWSPDLTSYNINIIVMDGRVTLDGTVTAYWEKMRAENEAWDVRGVTEVINKLAVVPTAKITDERIAQDVVDAIDRNLYVDVDDVNVTVRDGKVTLTGKVPGWGAKSAAYRSALYTQGVTNVENNITID